jgi:hypothetical protein
MIKENVFDSEYINVPAKTLAADAHTATECVLQIPWKKIHFIY